MIHPIRRRRQRDERRIITLLRLADREWRVLDIAELLGTSMPRVWAALARLERLGSVTSRWEELQAGEDRPRRRLYAATDGDAGDQRGGAEEDGRG